MGRPMGGLVSRPRMRRLGVSRFGVCGLGMGRLRRRGVAARGVGMLRRTAAAALMAVAARRFVPPLRRCRRIEIAPRAGAPVGRRQAHADELLDVAADTAARRDRRTRRRRRSAPARAVRPMRWT